MKMDMRRPCAKCPFRTDVTPYLRPARCHEILTVLVRQDGTFACHETTVESADGDNMLVTKDSQHCAGAMILLETMEKPNQLMRIFERLGMYKMRMLDRTAPVYNSAKDMYAAYKRAWHR